MSQVLMDDGISHDFKHMIQKVKLKAIVQILAPRVHIPFWAMKTKVALQNVHAIRALDIIEPGRVIGIMISKHRREEDSGIGPPEHTKRLPVTAVRLAISVSCIDKDKNFRQLN